MHNSLGHAMTLKDRVILITGGSMGIGFGCAKVMGTKGGKVVFCSPDATGGEPAQQSLRDQGIDATWVRCDVRVESDVRELVASAVNLHGRLDCIVNNAGWHPPAVDIEAISTDDFESLIRLNLTSTFWGCKFATPHLKATRGSIINIGSLVGELGQAQAVSYVTTKAGQIGLTKALAIDLAPHGVRVNAVCPAGVRTPMMEAWAATLGDPASALSREDANHALGRMATIEEVGAVCAFLASDDACFVTGQILRPDGGASLGYQ